MQIQGIAFAATDGWALERIEHSAQAGQAFWRTLQLGDIRVRMVEYTAAHVADHAEPHRSRAPQGATLFIVD